MLANLLAPFRRSNRKSQSARQRRRLRMDALEERTLLSVTPVDILDKLVNQSLIPSGGTIAGQSLAVDADGDFVVVWTRYDTVYDPNTGLPLTDPLTGQAQTEANIYARYFTDEVQRITLPSGVLNDTISNQYGRFSLIYGGTTIVQKLTVSATYEPYTSYQSPIVGTFVLQADANGDGVISPTERATVNYNETSDINVLATSIQTALQGIGGPLQNAKVTPINAKEFSIEYGSAALGVNQPKLSVTNVQFDSGFYPAVQIQTVREPILISNIAVSPTNPQQTAQALEQVFNTRLQAYAMGPIDFPPSNRVPSATEGPYQEPLVTAAAIPQISVTAVSPTVFDIRFIGDSAKQDHPELIIASVSDEFGNSLLPSSQAVVTTVKQSSPEFRVNPEEPDDPFTPGPDKFDQTDPAVAMDADGDFVIVWQSEVPDSQNFGSVSDVFARRFRPVGSANLGVSQFVVDMDANGTPETPISGVIPLVSPLKVVSQVLTVDSFAPGAVNAQFRLRLAGRETVDITFDSTQLTTTAARIQGALVMAGFQNVVVQVASGSDPYQFRVTYTQTFSGPNGLADAILEYIDPLLGTPLSALANVSSDLVPGQDLFTFQVNTESLRRQFSPSVGMDMLGNFVIAWANSAQDFSYYNGIKAQIFDRNGNQVGSEFLVNTEDTAVYLDPAVGMARTGEFVIAFERTHDVNYLTGSGYATSVLAKGYNLAGQVILPQFGVGGGGAPTISFDSANHFLVTWQAVADADNIGGTSSGVRAIVYDLNGNVVRDTFRPNSASFDPASAAFWPFFQGGSQGGLDADGDLIVSYDGYGPDVSTDIVDTSLAIRQLLARQINAQTNADLLNYFDPQSEYINWAGYPSNEDVDGALETILVRALNRGATAEQVGRLRAILESVTSLLRGEANGVMFSRFDASPSMAYSILFSDSVANTLRDGHNTRYLILMDRNLNWESFVIRLWRAEVGNYEDVTVNNIQTNQVWNQTLTRDRIDAVLEAAARTGVNWAENRYEGPVDVRIIDSWEAASRMGTPWEIPVADPTQYVIYEVTFQGEGHESQFSMAGVWPGRAGGQDVSPPRMIVETYADYGVSQADASMGVTPEGSFVIAYTQYELDTSGNPTNATIRYRQFRETADTAGPFITDIVSPQGSSLWGGTTVQGPVNQVVVTFNEELMGGDPATVLDSILNPENFVLLRNGVEIPHGVVKVEFGMNASSLLNGQTYDIDGDGVADGVYQFDLLPSNKWEAVLTLDGNGALESGFAGLGDGQYQLVLRAPSGTTSGLRDKVGNALNSTGFLPAGADSTLSFNVMVLADDAPVLPVNARTQPESPNAVARDADGDYVVVWTQTDAAGRNRVYYRLFDRDGTAADLDLNGNGVIDAGEVDNAPATPVTTSTAFASDDQQFGSVAMTPDGDFVITWTNARSGSSSDIYARRFAANGQAQGEAFLVNTFTSNNQKWSDVAMDAEGRFVVVWSSYNQERGTSVADWGVFARRYDENGQAMGAETQVNTIVAGNQRFPSVSMDYRGNYAVAWQTPGGIALRTFDAAGVALQAAELVLGQGVLGQKSNPDVAMAASGQYLAVSWVAPDGNGNGVYVDLLAWDAAAQAWNAVGTTQRVNTSLQGDQAYASVAMAVDGSFVVTWSGIGTQPGQEDQLESGVFYQEFSNTAAKVGGERRVNRAVAGKQWAPSVGVDADGNFIVLFTGPSGTNPSLTTIYHFDSRVYLNKGDISAPIVTQVLTGDRHLIGEGSRVTLGPQGLIVVLSEEMSRRLADINGDGAIDAGDSPATDSILNLENWKLFRDGQEVVGAIKSVSFQFNPLTRKYEAVLTLDSDPNTTVLEALVPGEYQLLVKDVMTDAYPYFRLTDPITGHRLDGDRDGVAGTAGGALGFVRTFQVVSGEILEDQPAVPVLPGNARTQPESPNAVARDADGDYVVVWTQTDAAGRNRVYYRLFDRDGTPADLDLNGNGVIDASEVDNAPATPVTTSTAFASDDQQFGSVAMTPDGDFVITWTNTRANNADIYARRFAANGQAQGEALLVNTFTANDQKWSDVAMDAEGGFVVVWSSWGQETGGSTSGWGIYGKRFDQLGQVVGTEFHVNTTVVGDQTLPSVAMDYRGNYAVAWQTAGGIALRTFNSAGVALQAAELVLGQGVLGQKSNPDVAMAASGQYLAVSWMGPDANGNGVYVDLLAWDGATQAWNAVGASQLVNTSLQGDQGYASVAMAVDGSFVVTWSGIGTQLNEEDLVQSGVFYQRFDATGAKIGSERRVNQVVAGKQWAPSVATDADGNFIVVFTGPLSSNPALTTVYRFDSRSYLTLDDISAPIVTRVLTSDRQLISEGSRVTPGPQGLIVVLSEEMSRRLADANGNGVIDAGDSPATDSILNLQNWKLFRGGQEIVGAIKSVSFQYNRLTRKYEAVLTLDSNPNTTALEALVPGEYQLLVKDVMTDAYPYFRLTDPITGHRLDGDRDGVPGTAGGALGFVRNFRVVAEPTPPPPDQPVIPGVPGQNLRTQPESPNAVARDADGDYVVVWTQTDAAGRNRVYYRLFDRDGTPADLDLNGNGVIDASEVDNAPATPVTTSTAFANDDQQFGSVAMTPDGDFVITWTNTRANNADIYARRFAANGQAQGEALLVNTFTANDQKWSDVATDVEGNFIVVWSSYNQLDESVAQNSWDIFARRFDQFGQPLGLEFLVNVTTAGDQTLPSVAMDFSGGFVVAWQSNPGRQGTDIFARSFWPDGSPQAEGIGSGWYYGEFLVNQTITGDQTNPDVAISPSGEQYVVTWAGPDSNSQGVYVRQFSRILDPFTALRRVYHSDILAPGIPIYHYVTDTAPYTVQVPYTITDTITISDIGQIQDLNVTLNIQHRRASDLLVQLRHVDTGTTVVLSDRNPQRPAGTYATGANFANTIFDDEAATTITLGSPPFTGRFVPAPDALSAFDGESTDGDWELVITDLYYDYRNDPREYPYALDGYLVSWNLDFSTQPPSSAEMLVNETTAGMQNAASVAMAYDGSFVVTWTGRGSIAGQEDTSGTGVFYRKFDALAAPTTGEVRANNTTAGDQKFSSVAMDADGNFIIVFTGPVSTSSQYTTVYQFDSRVHLLATDFIPAEPDTAGAVPVLVRTASGEVLYPNAVLNGSISELRVTFSENLTSELVDTNGDQIPDSISNPQNWQLYRDGQMVPFAVTEVTFGWNPVLRKYEARVKFDADPATPGIEPLGKGVYSLRLADNVVDLAGIQIDVDRDGAPGDSSQLGYYERVFTIAPLTTNYEKLVNESLGYIQALSTSYGSGMAMDRNRRTLAADAEGNFAVVWMSYGQDDPSDSKGSGVYVRVFDRDGTPITHEILVNQTVVGDQANPVIAMDADGDFVVVWESVDNSANGSRGIWARLFDSTGQALTDEILVNTLTSGDQYSPAVAIDDFGNFVVVWATRGQPFSYYNDLKGQLFNYRGEKVGSEFMVNQQNIAGATSLPGSNETHPAVAMDPQGNFVVVWEQVVQERNGVALDTIIVGRLFQADGTAVTDEFEVSVGSASMVDSEHQTEDSSGGVDVQRRGRNAQVMMDRLGNFTVVWEAYQDNDLGTGTAESYGIYFRHFNADGTPADDEHQANLVITETAQNATVPGDPSRYFAYNQLNPSIAIDANGQYVVVWDGNGAVPHALSVTDKSYTDWDRDGVWIRYFQATPAAGDLEFISTQSRVPYTLYGVQHFPSVAKTLDGDTIVVWSGRGIGDADGVFFRKYNSSTDLAGPIVTDVYADDGTRLVGSRSGNVRISEQVNTLTVVFSEDMMRTGADAVTNPQNYVLLKDGSEVIAVRSVTFGLNPATNKWEAVLTVDGDPLTAGNQPLANGNYELRMVAPVLATPGTAGRSGLRDKAGNALNESGLTQGGSDFVVNFRVVVVGGSPGTPGGGDSDFITNTTLTYDQTEPVVAVDSATGNTIIVWTSQNDEPDPADPTATTLATNIMAQIYNRHGEPVGSEFIVNNDTTGNQGQPAVAVDSSGRFIIVWSGQGQSDTDGGIWARIFDSQGSALGQQFRVNQFRQYTQHSPKVATDSAGNFVITWSSYGQSDDIDAVYARLYTQSGQAKGNEFRLNTTTAGYQRNSDVAMDDAGNFVAVWMSDGQDGNAYGIVGRVFNANGTARTGEFLVNQYTPNEQRDPRVAMDGAGDFVVTWTSYGQDGSGYGVYARCYGSNGVAKGNEFRVNQTTLYWQFQPEVAMDAQGNFTIVWTTTGQDNDLANDNGIYARMFAADGSDRSIPNLGKLGEFRVNAFVTGNQNTPAIGMDRAGNFVVAWSGPSTDPDPTVAATNGTDVFARWFQLPSLLRMSQTANELVIEGTNGNDVFEFTAGTSLTKSTLKVNGQTVSIPSGVSRVVFDAKGGQDKITITGTSGADTATFSPTQTTFEFGSSQTLVVLNGEQVKIDGKGGTDALRVYDSPRTDNYTATPTRVTGSDNLSSYSLEATNFENVVLTSRAGGEDVAMLYDSPGDDTFTATPTYGEMVGTGYKLRAEGFAFLHGYASAGGTDTAMLYDSPGDDEYVCTPDYNILRGENFYLRAKYFDYVHAYATAGGYDKATIKGSAGNDKINLDQKVVRLNSGSYVHRGKFFEEVTVRGCGGQDTAYVTDGIVLPGTVSRGTPPISLDASQIVYLRQLYKIQTTNEGGNGTNRTIRPAADAVFTAYWP